MKNKGMDMSPCQLVTIVRRSCLTGKAVWVHCGMSRHAAHQAYYDACRKEMERVRQWPETIERRRANIGRLLAALTAAIPFGVTMTAEQEAAARLLHDIEQRPPACHRDFYDHIVEERRRRRQAAPRNGIKKKN